MKNLLRILKPNAIAWVMILVGAGIIVFVTKMERKFGSRSLWKSAALLYRGALPPFSQTMKNIEALMNTGEPSTEQHNTNTTTSQPIRILLWTVPTKESTFYNSHINEQFKKCMYSNCEIITDKSQLNQSKGVLFSTNQLSSYVDDLPPYKPMDQQWIFHSHHPPTAINVGQEFDGLFNLIAYHRADADIRTGYAYFQEKESGRGNETTPVDYAKEKRKLLVWIVGQCTSNSKRELYVKELQKYVDIDICGPCGNSTCGVESGTDSKPENGPIKLAETISRYKFTLAFENSICPDYITEKLWLPMLLGTVPVVLGGAEYDNFLPAGSYIDVRDYSSPKLLAEHLIELDEDDQAYNRYLAWKADYKINLDMGVPCQLCAALSRDDESPSRVYDNFYYWLNKCTEPEDFYQQITDNVVENIQNSQ